MLYIKTSWTRQKRKPMWLRHQFHARQQWMNVSTWIIRLHSYHNSSYYKERKNDFYIYSIYNLRFITYCWAFNVCVKFKCSLSVYIQLKNRKKEHFIEYDGFEIRISVLLIKSTNWCFDKIAYRSIFHSTLNDTLMYLNAIKINKPRNMNESLLPFDINVMIENRNWNWSTEKCIFFSCQKYILITIHTNKTVFHFI